MNPSTLIASPPNPARFRRVPVPERHFPDQRRASKTMDFRLSEEHQLFQNSVRGFAERNLAKGNPKRAPEADLPWDGAHLMSAERREGKEWGSTCKTRRTHSPKKKKKQ